MDLIEIFRVGTHTDSAGKNRDWTDQDLEEIVSLYNPAIHEAPVVIGHPEHDSPAYGWVESLKVEGGNLLAKLKDVAPEFKDWVKRGLYKKISIALYPDLGLRHIGFLGATPPAIKGLKQTTFGDKKAAWIIEEDMEKQFKIGTQGFSPDNLEKGGKLMDFKKFFSDLVALIHGAEKELVPTDTDTRHGHAYTEADLAAAEKRGKDAQAAAMFAETEKLKKEKADAEAKVKEIEVKARKDEIHAFSEGLAKNGQIIPAWQKMGIEEFLFSLDAGESVKFAEGHEKSRSQWFKDFLTDLPQVVTFNEVTSKEGPGAGGSAGQKLSVLTKKTMEEKKIPWSQAFSEVQKENIELAREYQTEISPKQ